MLISVEHQNLIQHACHVLSKKGGTMKIARTYTIDVHVATDLKQKHNQSQFVEDAIKAKLYPSGQTKHISEYNRLELLTRLIKLFEQDSMEYRLLENMWTAENKKHITSLNLDANL